MSARPRPLHPARPQPAVTPRWVRRHSARWVLLAASGLWWSVAPAEAAPPVVATVLAGGAPVGQGFELEASLQAQRQATVAAQLGGNVVALAVKAGDVVKAGQLLARIDERDTAAGLARGEAGLAQAEAELRQARTQAERQRALRAQGFVSQAAVDQAETALQAAQAGVQVAHAGRSQAALARGFANVTAPFAGTVLATHVEAGDLATPGRPIATLFVPGALRAVAQLPASRAAAARAATDVQVQLPTADGLGRWVKPLRQTALPGTDPVSQTTEWRLDLATADTPGLQPGQALRVRFAGPPAGAVSVSNTTRLRLPSSAVLQRGELSAVYVQQGTSFQLRAVRLGARSADQVDVLAGLKAGEAVAVDALQAGLAGARPAAR